MIKAILFDVDGVLLDSWEANIRFYQLLLEKSGYDVPSRNEIEGVFHLPMLDAIRQLTQETSEARVREVWEMGRGRKVRYPRELLKLPAKASEVVKKLSRAYRLAIVTSRVRAGVKDFFTVSGLKQYFTVVVSYEDYSHPKPHPEPLLIAIERLGLKAKEAVYIGDTPTDVKAAKAAGVKIIVYSAQPLEGADLWISSFDELPKAVRKIGDKGS